jgi:hypothetical protein
VVRDKKQGSRNKSENSRLITYYLSLFIIYCLLLPLMFRLLYERKKGMDLIKPAIALCSFGWLRNVTVKVRDLEQSNNHPIGWFFGGDLLAF